MAYRLSRLFLRQSGDPSIVLGPKRDELCTHETRKSQVTNIGEVSVFSSPTVKLGIVGS